MSDHKGKEIVIIGAGVAGCSIAFHLARRGIPSLIVERESIAARASGKAWAVWTHPLRWLGMEGRPFQNSLFSMPDRGIRPWMELLWLGYSRLPEAVLEIQEKGGLDVQYGELRRIVAAGSEVEEKQYRGLLTRFQDEGYNQVEWVDAQDIRGIFPDVNRRVRGGLLYPAFVAEPYRFTLGLAQAAEKLGADIRQGEVVSFRTKGSKVNSVVLASGTEIAADIVVLAMGPWSEKGCSLLGENVPVLVSRDQCLKVEVPQKLPPYMITCGVSIVPQVDGTVILGHSGIPDLQPEFNAGLTDEARMEILEGAIDLLPGLQDARLVEQRGDLEGWAPAPRFMQPVMGRFPKWDNAYTVARLGTLGMTMSLAIGQLMADSIINSGNPPFYAKSVMEYLSLANLEA
jgi:glycine oxidase